MLQQPSTFGVLDGRDVFGEPAFEQQQLPVDGGQDAALHEQVTQVGCRAFARQLLERLVGQGHASGREVVEEVANREFGDPAQSAFWFVHTPQHIEKRTQQWVNAAGAVVQCGGEFVGERAAFV